MPTPNSPDSYELIYWGGIPGRGEYVRLAFEATSTPYTNITDAKAIGSLFNNSTKTGHPPHFAPPILHLPASNTFISQTPNILNFLAPRLGLAGDAGGGADEKEMQRAVVNQLVLTALDLSNETHDVHHPISSGLYYEEQKEAALLRALDFRRNRIPKFFKHFEIALSSNPTESGYLVGSSLTTADLVLFHVVDGLLFAFPAALTRLRDGERFPSVFALHERVKTESGIKKYLESGRRQKFGNGLYRYYEELDDQEGEKFD